VQDSSHYFSAHSNIAPSMSNDIQTHLKCYNRLKCAQVCLILEIHSATDFVMISSGSIDKSIVFDGEGIRCGLRRRIVRRVRRGCGGMRVSRSLEGVRQQAEVHLPRQWRRRLYCGVARRNVLGLRARGLRRVQSTQIDIRVWRRLVQFGRSSLLRSIPAIVAPVGRSMDIPMKIGERSNAYGNILF
jgi:hypothetical protein